MQISEFNKEEIDKMYQSDQSSIWKEYGFYKAIDKSRREILGLFLEIDNAYGNWNFMDRVLPSLFEELYNVFNNTLQIILKNIKKINYNIWVDSWYYFPEYREKQNQESSYYYLLEYLISKFKEDFILKKPLSEHYSKNYYERTIKKTKIRILNILYYFHHKSIEFTQNKAGESFLEIIREKLQKLELPLLTYPDSLFYDFNLKYGKEKFKELFNHSYGNIEYKLGLEPIWEDENTGISTYYFNNIENPFILLTNQNDISLLDLIKKSREEVVFQEWFHTPEIKQEIINHYFFPIYYKYLRNEDLSQQDIEKSKNKINNAYLKLKNHYGITDTLSELIKSFRLEQEKRIDEETPIYPSNSGADYDLEMDIEDHSNYVLNSIFPIIPFSWSKYNNEIEPEEIAIIDLETTGDSFYSDSIVEIGICKLNLKTGNIEPLFNEICQEKDKRIEYDAWIFKNSDLNYYDILNAPDISEFRKEIQHILNSYCITAYPQNFDFTFLEYREFKIRKRFWDPMLKLQYLLKIPRYNGNYKWPSIQESWNYLFPNIKYKPTHRALDDTYYVAQIIYEYIKQTQTEKDEKE